MIVFSPSILGSGGLGADGLGSAEFVGASGRASSPLSLLTGLPGALVALLNQLKTIRSRVRRVGSRGLWGARLVLGICWHPTRIARTPAGTNECPEVWVNFNPAGPVSRIRENAMRRFQRGDSVACERR